VKNSDADFCGRPPPEAGAARGHIRSFVRREGRMTPAQRRALAELWPQFGIAPGSGLLSPRTVFGRRAPLALEIGFGNGEALAQLAGRRPEWDFIGMEVHRPGIGALLRKLHQQSLSNVRIIRADAAVALRDNIPDASLDLLMLFFPDPWPKKRHHKRRLVQENFAALCRRKLRPGGMLHAATDWRDYAVQMMEVFSACPQLQNAAGENRYSRRPPHRPVTRFEKRGAGLGHATLDLIFTRRG